MHDRVKIFFPIESQSENGVTGMFDYDSLGNIRQKTLGTRVVDIEYNIDNQVSRVRDTDDGSVWRYYTHDAKV